MKKGLIFVWVFIAVISNSFAETGDGFIENGWKKLNGGNAISAAIFDEPTAMMKNYKGELFFIFIQEGSIQIKRSIDQGQSFQEYHPELHGYLFLEIRDIKFFANTGEQMYFFIGKTEESDGIYALTFDGNGELSLDPWYRLDSIETGIIHSYSIHSDDGNNFSIFYNKSDCLKGAFINVNTKERMFFDISDYSDVVTDLEIKNVFFQGTFAHSGVYSSDQGKSCFVHIDGAVFKSPIANSESIEKVVISSLGAAIDFHFRDNQKIILKTFQGTWSESEIFIDGSGISDWGLIAIGNIPYISLIHNDDLEKSYWVIDSKLEDIRLLKKINMDNRIELTVNTFFENPLTNEIYSDDSGNLIIHYYDSLDFLEQTIVDINTTEEEVKLVIGLERLMFIGTFSNNENFLFIYSLSAGTYKLIQKINLKNNNIDWSDFKVQKSWDGQNTFFNLDSYYISYSFTSNIVEINESSYLILGKQGNDVEYLLASDASFYFIYTREAE